MTILDEITALQERIAQAERDRARAEGTRDAAQTALNQAVEQLHRDFGIDNLDEGEKFLAVLHTKLAADTARMTALLDQIGV